MTKLPKIFAAILLFAVILLGQQHITSFIEAVVNPGRSGNRPEDILIGAILLSLAVIGVKGVYKIFSKK